jgi:hypothetical protein
MGKQPCRRTGSENWGRTIGPLACEVHEPVHVGAIRPQTDKDTRMHAQTAMIDNGFVYLPKEAAWDKLRAAFVSGSTRAESAITCIGSCIPTMDQIRKTIPDGLPTGV